MVLVAAYAASSPLLAYASENTYGELPVVFTHRVMWFPFVHFTPAGIGTGGEGGGVGGLGSHFFHTPPVAEVQCMELHDEVALASRVALSSFPKSNSMLTVEVPLILTTVPFAVFQLLGCSDTALNAPVRSSTMS
jgi:hypothetical protein